MNIDHFILCSSSFLSIVIGETISPWERKVINPLYTCCPARPLNTSAGLYRVIPQLTMKSWYRVFLTDTQKSLIETNMFEDRSIIYLFIYYSFSKAETQSFALDKISIVSIYLIFFDNHWRRVGVCFI